MNTHYPELTKKILNWSLDLGLYGLPFDELTYLYANNMNKVPKDEFGYKTFKGWSKKYSARGKYEKLSDKMIVGNLKDYLLSLNKVDFIKQNKGGFISQNIMNNYILLEELNRLYGDEIDIRHKINLFLLGKRNVPKCEICENDALPRKTHGEFRKTCSEKCRRELESDCRNYLINIDNNDIKVQGYERYVIFDLLEKYDISDIRIGFDIDPIEYKFNNKIHLYYPDFYIVPENKIVEVKSTYTFKYELDRNYAKRKSCIDKGYNFEFIIWDMNKII